jgi:hypothetical protein
MALDSQDRKVFEKFSQKYEKIGFFSLSWTLHLPQVSGKGICFFYLFINFSIFFQPCKDSPGQPGQDSQCRISRTGLLGQDMYVKTDRTGQ